MMFWIVSEPTPTASEFAGAAVTFTVAVSVLPLLQWTVTVYVDGDGGGQSPTSLDLLPLITGWTAPVAPLGSAGLDVTDETVAPPEQDGRLKAVSTPAATVGSEPSSAVPADCA